MRRTPNREHYKTGKLCFKYSLFTINRIGVFDFIIKASERENLFLSVSVCYFAMYAVVREDLLEPDLQWKNLYSLGFDC